MEQSKDVLRVAPLGVDRDHRRYWLFTGEPGLFVERGWFDIDTGGVPQPPADDDEGGGSGATAAIKPAPATPPADDSSDDDAFDGRKRHKNRERTLAPHPRAPLNVSPPS